MLCAMRSTLNIAVRVELTARHVPSQAGYETSEGFETRLYGCYLSIACTPQTTYSVQRDQSTEDMDDGERTVYGPVVDIAESPVF
jgi:hypothetical protein